MSIFAFDDKGNPIQEKTSNKGSKASNSKVESEFTKRLQKALATKEVKLADGSMVSNMDAIIDSLIGRAIEGDKESIRLIKDLS